MTPEGVRLELKGRGTASAPRSGTRRRSCASAPTRPCRARACSRRPIGSRPHPARATLSRDIQRMPLRRRGAQSASPLARISCRSSWWRSSPCSRHGPPRGWRSGLGVRASRPTRRRSPPASPFTRRSNSVVFAADGTRLGYIHSDTIRQPVKSGEIPKRPQARHGRDRGPALLRARRHRPGAIVRAACRGRQGRRARPGRLDDHPAAGPQPLHRRTRRTTIERKIQEADLADESSTSTRSSRSSPST